MPSKDSTHEAVVQSLIKDGWTIADEQVGLRVDKRRLWIDIQASKEISNITMLVEVKGFVDKSQIDYLHSPIGQYVIYRAVIEATSLGQPLYMAIPLDAYEGIFSEEIGQIIIQKIGLKLIVFDVEKE